MFAVNRIIKVKGRISILIDSISTIKGAKNKGVLLGTRWIIRLFVSVNNLLKVKEIHTGNDNIIVKDRCLVGVKIKGSNLNRFIIQIELNTVMSTIIILMWDFFKFFFKSFIIR